MNIIIEKEVALHQFEVRTDKTQVLKLLHADFKEVGESGNSYTLKSILDHLGQEQPNSGQIHSQEFESFELSPETYLLLYKSVRVNVDGKYSNFAKRSSIWSLTENGWQMKYHQGTPCDRFDIRM